jgi:hypothetical protein
VEYGIFGRFSFIVFLKNGMECGIVGKFSKSGMAYGIVGNFSFITLLTTVWNMEYLAILFQYSNVSVSNRTVPPVIFTNSTHTPFPCQ